MAIKVTLIVLEDCEIFRIFFILCFSENLILRSDYYLVLVWIHFIHDRSEFLNRTDSMQEIVIAINQINRISTGGFNTQPPDTGAVGKFLPGAAVVQIEIHVKWGAEAKG